MEGWAVGFTGNGGASRIWKGVGGYCICVRKDTRRAVFPCLFFFKVLLARSRHFWQSG